MSLPKLKPRYSIDIRLDGTDMTGYFARGFWLCADSLVAEGNSLGELIESAEIFTQDQDGGEGPSVRLFTRSFEKLE